jgi:hypothetical protein
MKLWAHSLNFGTYNLYFSISTLQQTAMETIKTDSSENCLICTRYSFLFQSIKLVDAVAIVALSLNSSLNPGNPSPPSCTRKGNIFLAYFKL